MRWRLPGCFHLSGAAHTSNSGACPSFWLDVYAGPRGCRPMFEIYGFKKDYRNLANMFFEVGFVQSKKGRKKTKTSGAIRVLL